MFVPPCRESFEDNLEFALYSCPVTYSRRSVEYLGIYANKAVRAIGRIAKTVACNVDLPSNKLTVEDEKIALTDSETQRIVGASRNAENRDWDVTTGHKFFLCDRLIETDFRKRTSGGIMGHRYFDLEEVLGGSIPTNVQELASALRQHTWD